MSWEDRLDALLCFSEDAVLVVDHRGRIRHVNRHAAALFAYDEDQLIGAELDLLVPDAARLHHRDLLADFVRSVECGRSMAQRREITARRRDGAVIPVTVSLARVEGSDPPLVVATVRDASERRRLEETIDWLATHDPLTGLPVRSSLLGGGELPVPFHGTVLAIDVDDFGPLNDAIGTAAADEVLVRLAERLLRYTLGGDGRVARLGSDEFLVVLPTVTDEATAAVVAQELDGLLRVPMAVGGTPVNGGGTRVTIGVSMGGALGGPDGDDPDALVIHAATALAEARNSRTGSLVLHDAHLAADAVGRAQLARDLRAALPRGELQLAYQPLVDVDTGLPCAAEALLRWTHPEHGPVNPSYFIRVAEASDLIDEISAFTLHEACTQLVRWSSEPWMTDDFRVAVNISARQLRSRNLIEDLRHALDATGVEPRRLRLEVTETAAMEDLALGADVLRGLRQLGVSVALDDFGTGYSSLARLGSLPIDELKIDGSLIAGIVSDLQSVAIVSAMLSLSKVFALVVVAEGVETAEQLRVLRELGCPVVQGWYFARAEAPEDFVATVSELRARAGAAPTPA